MSTAASNASPGKSRIPLYFTLFYPIEDSWTLEQPLLSTELFFFFVLGIRNTVTYTGVLNTCDRFTKEHLPAARAVARPSTQDSESCGHGHGLMAHLKIFFQPSRARTSSTQMPESIKCSITSSAQAETTDGDLLA